MCLECVLHYWMLLVHWEIASRLDGELMGVNWEKRQSRLGFEDCFPWGIFSDAQIRGQMSLLVPSPSWRRRTWYQSVGHSCFCLGLLTRVVANIPWKHAELMIQETMKSCHSPQIGRQEWALWEVKQARYKKTGAWAWWQMPVFLSRRRRRQEVRSSRVIISYIANQGWPGVLIMCLSDCSMMKYNGRSNLGMERVLWTPQLEGTILMAVKAAADIASTVKQQGLMNAAVQLHPPCSFSPELQPGVKLSHVFLFS